jgi:tight adherence protein B
MTHPPLTHSGKSRNTWLERPGWKTQVPDTIGSVTVIDQNIIVLAAIVFFASAVFFVARRLLDRDQARLERRLAFPDDGYKPGSLVPATSPDWAERLDRSFGGLVHRTGLGLSPAQTLSLFALTAGALAVLLFFWRGEEWAAALGLVLGIILAFLFLWVLERRRRRLIQSQLPDAFYFMARSLRAGLSLEQTLTRAGEQLEDPLAAEFRRCASQIQLGLHPHQALLITANRLALSDFDVFAATVGLYYRSGGNLALLLDRLAASTRDRIQFLGYFRAATALARAAGFFLAAAVPALVIAYAAWQPEHVGMLFHSAAGWQILGIAALLELAGIVWFLYLLRVDY